MIVIHVPDVSFPFPFIYGRWKIPFQAHNDSGIFFLSFRNTVLLVTGRIEMFEYKYNKSAGVTKSMEAEKPCLFKFVMRQQRGVSVG